MKQWRCDLHCHTKYSYDGYNTYKDLLWAAQKYKLDAIAITDHDRIKITKKTKKKFTSQDISLISGCEITAQNNIHIIGLFITSQPLQKDLRAVTNFIIDQGGVISIPHPFKPGSGLLARESLKNPDVQYLLQKATFIEIYNGKFSDKDARLHERQIKKIAKKNNLKLIIGSDSHKIWDFNYNTNTISAPFLNAENFKHCKVTLSLTKTKKTESKLNNKPSRTLRLGRRLLPTLIKKSIRQLLYLHQSTAFKKRKFH